MGVVFVVALVGGLFVFLRGQDWTPVRALAAAFAGALAAVEGGAPGGGATGDVAAGFSAAGKIGVTTGAGAAGVVAIGGIAFSDFL